MDDGVPNTCTRRIGCRCSRRISADPVLMGAPKIGDIKWPGGSGSGTPTRVQRSTSPPNVLGNSLIGSSQSDGAVDGSGRAARGQLEAAKDASEVAVGREIPVERDLTT